MAAAHPATAAEPQAGSSSAAKPKARKRGAAKAATALAGSSVQERGGQEPAKRRKKHGVRSRNAYVDTFLQGEEVRVSINLRCRPQQPLMLWLATQTPAVPMSGLGFLIHHGVLTRTAETATRTWKNGSCSNAAGSTSKGAVFLWVKKPGETGGPAWDLGGMLSSIGFIATSAVIVAQ